MDNKVKKIIVAVNLGLFFVFMIFMGVYTVETGKQGAVSRFGKFYTITNEGLHFKIPFIDKVDQITVRNSTYTFEDLEVSTKDMQTITLKLAVQISVTDLDVLYRKYKNNYERSLISPRVREIVQANVAKYTIEEFVEKRQQLSLNIFESIQKDFTDDGLAINNVSIVNHDFSDKYERAVEDKKVAEQSVETAKFIQEKARIEAQNKVELARFKFEEKKLQAQANKVESESLSPELLQKMQLEKWNGVLPQVMNTDGKGLIYNLNNQL